MNLAAAHALAKPQYGDKKESLLARSVAEIDTGHANERTPAVIYAEWNCISRVSGEWGCCGCVPRVGPEGLSLEDPLSGRLHKEGGERSHFSLRQQFKLNFFERPSDQKRAAKKEEGIREGEVQVGRAARKRCPWALWAHTH